VETLLDRLLCIFHVCC